MNILDKILVSNKNYQDYFWVQYHVRAKTNLLTAAKAIALGQSIGNPDMRSSLESDELIKNHCAVILDEGNLQKDRGIFWIGFPYANIDFDTDGISQLLCFMQGGNIDIDEFLTCQVLDVEIDSNVFLEPKYGISGLREKLGASNRPLFGAIVKPKTGLNANQLLDLVKEIADGGADWIKEDEILGNPRVCPFFDRVDLIGDFLSKSSYKVQYHFCINGDGSVPLRRAAYVGQNFPGMGVHVNFWSGLGMYREIRDMDTDLTIHYQKSGNKILCDHQHRFNINEYVFCKLAAMSGVDTYHAGMIAGGYANDSEEDVLKNVKLLQGYNILPTLSCGMHPGLVKPIQAKIGNDFIAASGGWIHSHESGTKIGCQEMKKAVLG